jgi:TetR/AcrR family tetracycline transcriptional repressor
MALDKGKIVTTAIRLLDKDGLEGVTLRKIATLLKVEAPALYWHFSSKAELIDEMAEAILQEHFKTLRARSSDEPWQDWLLKTAAHLRRAMLAHKDGARVIVGAHLFPALTLAALFETCLQSLVSAGLSTPDAHNVVVTVVHFTFGRAIEEQSGPTAAQMEEVMKPGGLHRFESKFPIMMRVMKDYTPSERRAAADFRQSVELILRGATTPAPTRKRVTHH